MSTTPFVWILLPVLALFGYLIYRLIKYGGFKGFAFGARIEEKIGEALSASTGYTATKVKVYALNGGPEKAIGLELSTGAGESVFFGSVSISQAEKLIELLQLATKAGSRNLSRP